jgi:DnaJ-class molecular chaperone
MVDFFDRSDFRRLNFQACTMEYRLLKAARTEYYKKYIDGNKMKTCSACSGSGYYDFQSSRGKPKTCGNCSGTGKERSVYKPCFAQFMRDYEKRANQPSHTTQP